MTSLLVAACSGNTLNVIALLEMGADAEHGDLDGNTVLHYAVICNNLNLL